MSDMHKTHIRAFWETARDSILRLADDPWLAVWHSHLLLTFIHFIWTEAPGCWNLRLRTLPFKKIFRNYFTCVLLINAMNTFWSLSVEEYW